MQGQPISASQSLGETLRVVRALLIREMMTRYGRRNIGFAWLIAEPLILIFGIVLVWSLAKGPSIHGAAVVPFALSGYAMLTLWRHQVLRCLSCPRDIAPLLFHRTVTLPRAFAGRFLLELVATLAASSIAYAVLRLFEICPPADDPLVVLIAWTLMGCLAFGIGLCLTGIVLLWENFERFVHPLLYLALPLSGAFALADWFRPAARSLLLLSPLVHATEMLRFGMMGEHHVFHFSSAYLAAATAITLLAGLALLRLGQQRAQ